MTLWLICKDNIAAGLNNWSVEGIAETERDAADRCLDKTYWIVPIFGPSYKMVPGMYHPKVEGSKPL